MKHRLPVSGNFRRMSSICLGRQNIRNVSGFAAICGYVVKTKQMPNWIHKKVHCKHPNEDSSDHVLIFRRGIARFCPSAS